jgi:hypothetical protein
VHATGHFPHPAFGQYAVASQIGCWHSPVEVVALVEENVVVVVVVVVVVLVVVVVFIVVLDVVVLLVVEVEVVVVVVLELVVVVVVFEVEVKHFATSGYPFCVKGSTEQHGQHVQNGRQQYSSGPPANRKHIGSHNRIVPSSRTIGLPSVSRSH